MAPLLISTFVIAWLAKFIAPAASNAPIFVAVKVSVENVKSLSSDNNPFVPANTNLPDVNPSAVNVCALKLYPPISTSAPAPSKIANFCAALVVKVPDCTSSVLPAPTVTLVVFIPPANTPVPVVLKFLNPAISTFESTTNAFDAAAVPFVIPSIVSNSSSLIFAEPMTNEPPVIAPVVVIAEEPVFIVPKPLVIEPLFNAPTVVAAVVTKFGIAVISSSK